MKKTFYLLLLCLLSIYGFAQKNKTDTTTHDVKAKALLDQLSAKTKSYQNMQVAFTYSNESTQKKKKTETYNGSVYLKGAKYKLILPGNEILCDGKTVWNYLKDAGEVNITTPDPNDESILNPTKLFTIYEKGFKYKMVGESTVKGVKLTEIDLFPENPKKKKFTMVRLFINKAKMQIASIKYQSKDGNNVSVDVTDFKTDTKMDDAMFVFDKTKYPKNVEVNDLREK